MAEKEQKNFNVMKYLFNILQGALIGLGAVLPGLSGGVLCVIFGVYKTVMEFLADPIKKFKTHFPKLLPYGIGLVIGFVGIAKVLEVLLEKYPGPSICVFIGLTVGMLPSLFKEAGLEGRTKGSYISMFSALAITFALLIGLFLLERQLDLAININIAWSIFCGFCLALSVIAPGMSFSTLLMPLGLYDSFIGGISNFSLGILIPAGIGALATVVLFSKGVNKLFDKHYSIAFHAIVGIVIAATTMIIPNEIEAIKVNPLADIICLACGIVAALLLDKFNSKFEKE